MDDNKNNTPKAKYNAKGRTKAEKKREKRLIIRLTDEEMKQLTKFSNGFTSVSNYVRVSCLQKGKYLINPIEYLKVIDNLIPEMKRIGNNINQIARYANFLEKEGQGRSEILQEFNSLLSQYIEIENGIYEQNSKILKR